MDIGKKMSHLFGKTVLLITSICIAQANAAGLRDCALSESAQEDSLIEHVYGGALNDDTLHARRAYVFAYDEQHLVPSWTAWHVIKSYRDTPERKSRWSTFRTDPEINQVSTRDYIGWYDSDSNFARGHIAPYFISGGDRDHDGKDAEFEDDLKVEDLDDACTVFEINAMTNVAPQYHRRFNGSPGVWWQLESDVRAMIDDGGEFYIFAGTIFIPNTEIMFIGDRKDDPAEWAIGVPHGFFKVIINADREQAVGFLFDHSANLGAGCDIDTAKWPSSCITSIDEIEAATGLSFFGDFDSNLRNRLKGSSSKSAWLEWLN